MKQITLIIFLFAIGALSVPVASAQQAKTLFVNMPDSLSPLLTAVNRADCIDFLESNMRALVENRFGRKSEMTVLGEDYIRMQMSPQTAWQMKVLPVNDSTKVVCTVSTVCAPVCDSDIKFYTTDWKELPAEEFLSARPVMDDFFQAADSTNYDFINARRHADMLLMQAELSKEAPTLTFTLTTPRYMEKETAEKLKPFLRRSIVYSWKDGKLIPGTL